MSLRSRTTFTHYRGHSIVTPPTVEPVTADELRAHLAETVDGLPYDQADDLIATAREMIEETTGIAMISQTWRLALDCWPAHRAEWWDGVRQGAIADINGAPDFVYLPRYPLASIDAVTVYDEASTAASVVVADTFDIDTYQKPGRMVLRSGATWPIALRGSNAIEIDYIAGFGATAASVPPTLRRAVKQVAAYLYSHTGDDCTPDDALGAAGSLLGAYRVKRI
jgi:hypothetical protein